jgi:hypothetical protein
LKDRASVFRHRQFPAWLHVTAIQVSDVVLYADDAMRIVTHEVRFCEREADHRGLIFGHAISGEDRSSDVS